MRRPLTSQHQQKRKGKIERKAQLRRWKKWILIGGYGEARMPHFPVPPLADPFFFHMLSCSLG